MSAADLAREATKYLREEADFNRSWTDGRRGSSSSNPGYIARRLEIAEQRDGWADAIQGLIEYVADLEAELEFQRNQPAARFTRMSLPNT
jgi:hypothetical protein